MTDLKSRVTDKKLPPWERLKLVMAILRSENGCSWDRKQTHRSLLPYLIEEAYEVVEAIEADDSAALCEELGDLLCQVVFHAQLANERNEFDADAAVEAIVQKLIRRHPHVFGEPNDLDPKQVRDQWERLKLESGEKTSLLSGLPTSMPALTMAYRIGEKAGGIGFDWNRPEEVIEKLIEELTEVKEAMASGDKVKQTEEIGDLLFAAASLARKLEVEPESALKQALAKFRQRFSLLEEKVRTSGKHFDDFTLEELEAIWQGVKKRRDQKG